ncbi:MAG: hypothetical protein IPG54_08050 [Sphingomonadales bacterium]|jgi:hypothetical protein|nr:hypothetical protein [Sphingomonadales bacterium]MBK9004787.1 hypothetical protein [Sphingomonadales bacterium]MBK9267486.1 hypothetical protein [Sphingomonadales bacterium]MBP6433229.1 hypothetical protein [Sphingorhabdus sp.]
MDNLRGFGSYDGDQFGADGPAYASFDEENEDAAIEPPPVISGDERRMQVRAYNFWTSHLGEGNYPNIEDLDPDSVEDFRDYSVLLDFTSGVENPSIQYLGEALRNECGLTDDITYLDQVPPRSLLSRITDHYLQIIANRAPIGFEAEFVNERGANIMYRGILLPYSSDDDTIDFLYGVINWKEAAPADITAPLAAEVEAALAAVPVRKDHVPVWADGPSADELELENALEDAPVEDELVLDASFADAPAPSAHADEIEIVASEPGSDSSLADWLDAARCSADLARETDVRSRDALYGAIGRAYDFSLAAERFPADYADLLSDNGITVQDRAPMTPVVKLIFGAGYDKTRLTEFAAALDYAHRNAVAAGGLADLLARHEGGLKGVVQAERRARKVEKGEHVKPVSVDPRPRLRNARARDLAEFAHGSEEFVVLVARRDADGQVVLVGSVDDAGLTDKVLAKTII